MQRNRKIFPETNLSGNFSAFPETKYTLLYIISDVVENLSLGGFVGFLYAIFK